VGISRKEVAINHPSHLREQTESFVLRNSDGISNTGKQSAFSKTGQLSRLYRSYDKFRCVIMQGGQGEVKLWAFNDPPKRTGNYKDAPPSLDEYLSLPARVVISIL